MQGQFKQQLLYDDVLTGQEFNKPLKSVPASWLLPLLIKFARKLAPSMLLGQIEHPYMYIPLASSCNGIEVSVPGREPPVSVNGLPNIREDMRLVEP